MNELTSFFREVTSKNKKDSLSDDWKVLLFIIVSEFGWTQKQLFETDIPFLLEVLRGREISLEKQKKMMK